MNTRPVYEYIRERHPSYRAGFMAGQAVKVMNKASPAFMMRPPPEDLNETIEIAHDICEVCDLRLCVISDEVWIYDEDHKKLIREVMLSRKDNHVLRGILCGIRPDLINPRFRKSEI